MPKFFSIIVFLFVVLHPSSLLRAQEEEQYNVLPLDYYLLKYPVIIEGEIKKIGVFDCRVKVIESIKGKLKKNRSVRVRYNFRWNGREKYQSKMDLKKNGHYIFILGRKSSIVSPLRLYDHSSRFIIKNDSLFLPYSLLKRFKFNSRVNIHETNTFGERNSIGGYKISKSDFLDLVQLLNRTYAFHTVGKGRYGYKQSCMHKLQEVDSTSLSSFQRSIFEHTESWWENVGYKKNKP